MLYSYYNKMYVWVKVNLVLKNKAVHKYITFQERRHTNGSTLHN